MAGYSPATTWQSWNQVYVTNVVTWYEPTWNAWNCVHYQQTNVATSNFTVPTQEHGLNIAAEEITRLKECADKRKAASVRAEALLLEHLDPHQRESYHKDKLFIVETPRKKRYKLSHSRPVCQLDGEREVVSYCIHTFGVPREDELLGFKLLLEANELEFLKTANPTRIAA